MSIGLLVVAKPGSDLRIVASVAGARRASCRPSLSAASAAITQLAPELLITTSRRPAGFHPLR